MSANSTTVRSEGDRTLNLVKFKDIRNQLEARMISLGLDPKDELSWEHTVGDEGVDDLVREVCNSERGALFLRDLEDFTVVKMIAVEDTLPGIIDLNAAVTKVDVVTVLVAMERLFKELQERQETLESNRGQLRAKLGEIMRANGELEFKANDSLGRPVANVKLELKFRPNWTEKDDQFRFLEAIGQGDVIQPSVPWQTAEKIMNSVVNDPEGIVELPAEPSVDAFVEARAKGAYPTTPYALCHPDGRNVIVEYTGDSDFPFRPVCNLYQTVVAKITKLY